MKVKEFLTEFGGVLIVVTGLAVGLITFFFNFANFIAEAETTREALPEQTEPRVAVRGWAPIVWTDPETQCQYLVYGAIIPREGKPCLGKL